MDYLLNRNIKATTEQDVEWSTDPIFRENIITGTKRLISLTRKNIMRHLKAQEAITLLGTNHKNQWFLPEEDWEKGKVVGVNGQVLGGAIAKIKTAIAHAKGILPIWTRIPEKSRLPLLIATLNKTSIIYKQDPNNQEYIENYGVVPYLLNRPEILFYKEKPRVFIVPEIEKYCAPGTKEAFVPILAWDGEILVKLDDPVKIRVDFTKAAGSKNFITFFLKHCAVHHFNNSSLVPENLGKTLQLPEKLKESLNHGLQTIDLFNKRYASMTEGLMGGTKKFESLLRKREAIAHQLGTESAEKDTQIQSLEQAQEDLKRVTEELAAKKEAIIRSRAHDAKGKMQHLWGLFSFLASSITDISESINKLFSEQEKAAIGNMVGNIETLKKAKGKLSDKIFSEVLPATETIISTYNDIALSGVKAGETPDLGEFQNAAKTISANFKKIKVYYEKNFPKNKLEAQIQKAVYSFLSKMLPFTLLVNSQYTNIFSTRLAEASDFVQTLFKLISQEHVEATEKESTNLVKELISFAKDNQAISFRNSEELKELHVNHLNSFAFTSSLLILYSNAIEAGATEIVFGLNKDNTKKQMTLTIKDNGPGIPEKLRKLILMLGFSTKGGAFTTITNVTKEEKEAIKAVPNLTFFEEESTLMLAKDFSGVILENPENNEYKRIHTLLVNRVETITALYKEAQQKAKANKVQNNNSGSGIGMDDLLRTIREAGGTVIIASICGIAGTPGIGTKITIKLPYQEKASLKEIKITKAMLSKRTPFSTQLKAAKPKLLVIDDQKMYFEAVKTICAHDTFSDILYASNAKDGLKAIAQLGPNDAVFLDINMPLTPDGVSDINAGILVAKQAFAANYPSHIIVCTSNLSPDVRKLLRGKTSGTRRKTDDGDQLVKDIFNYTVDLLNTTIE